MSASADTEVRLPGGQHDAESRWVILRARAARMFLSDPDSYLYFTWLQRNRAVTELGKLQVAISRLVVATEGMLSVPSSVPIPSTVRLQQLSERALSEAQVGADVLAGSLPATISEAQRVMRQVAKRTRARTRVQMRGDEAAKRFSEAKVEVVETWERALLRLRRYLAPMDTPAALLRARALEAPLQNLSRAVRDGVPTDEETRFASALLGGLSALAALSREISFAARLRIDSGVAFPRGFSVTTSGSSIFIVGPEGQPTPFPASLLSIAENDVVWINGTPSWSVESVSGNEVVLNDPIDRPVISLRIQSRGHFLWEQASKGLIEDFFLDNPNEVASPRRIRVLDQYKDMRSRVLLAEARSRPDAFALVEYLAQFFSFFWGPDTATPEIAASSDRMGWNFPGLLEPPRAVQEFLDSGIPLMSTDSFKHGRLLSRELRSAGFDRARDLLMDGHLEEFLLSDYQGASYSGRASAALARASRVIGQDSPIREL